MSAPELSIGRRTIGLREPTYFVADIGANHDGDMARALRLVTLAAQAGADAAKFQHFQAPTIVSDRGFRDLGGRLSHQATWAKSVYDVYQDASLDPEWTPMLAESCRDAGIDFLTTPYSFELVDALEPFVPAFKIGSGDITWLELIEYVAAKGKPVLLATGASTLEEVDAAVHKALPRNRGLVLMQCTTDYSGDAANLRWANLRVLTTFRERYPDAVLGLSDHTQGHVAALGAVALGARVIEKHFTDDRSRVGPDHPFSLTPAMWREMVDRVRDLEAALGDGSKQVEENETETVIVQRRALRTVRAIAAGTVIARDDLRPLRPCPPDALPPYELDEVVGRTTVRDLGEGEALRWADLR